MTIAFKIVLLIFIVIYLFDALATNALKYRIASGSIGAALAALYIAATLLL